MPTDTTESTLDAVRVFANSANSVQVFEALTDGPTTSRTLAERTGASRSTVARILAEGESRGWVDSEGSQYELTKVGEVMIEEFRSYTQTLEGIQHLGEAIDWLPPPVHSLDFRHFRDATVVTATTTNPAEPFDCVAEMMRTANEKRSLVKTVVPRFAELVDERSEAGQLDSELVVEAGWFDDLTAELEQVQLWRARADRNGVLTYDGKIPINLEIFDGTVIVWLGERHEDELVVRGVLVAESPPVKSWAESLYEEYRAEADPLDPTTLPEA